MKHWKFYATFILVFFAFLYLGNSIMLFGTELHYVTLHISGVLWLLTIGCWKDYKQLMEIED